MIIDYNNNNNNISITYNDLIKVVSEDNQGVLNKIWLLAFFSISPEEKLELKDLIKQAGSQREKDFLTRIWDAAFYKKADAMLRN